MRYGGAGGYGFFNAGGEIAVDRGARLLGNSGRSSLGDDSNPFNGNFYFEAGGHVAFDGKLTAQGLGPWGGAWGVMSFTGRSVSLGAKSSKTPSDSVRSTGACRDAF